MFLAFITVLFVENIVYFQRHPPTPHTQQNGY